MEVTTLEALSVTSKNPSCTHTSPACRKSTGNEELSSRAACACLKQDPGRMIYRLVQPSATAKVHDWLALLNVYWCDMTSSALRWFRPAGTTCLSPSWLRCSTVCLPRTYGRCGLWEVVGRMQFDQSLLLSFPYQPRVTTSGRNCQPSTDARETILWQTLCWDLAKLCPSAKLQGCF